MCNGRVKVVAALLLLWLQLCLSEPVVKGPPQFESKPLLLDSFLPASMQIIAHVSELMKYDLKPTTRPPYGPTSTSTVRPTPSHRPAIYAPIKPLGPEAYFAQRGITYKEYVKRLQQPSGYNYFDRYKFYLTEEETPSAGNVASHTQSRSYSEYNEDLNVDSTKSEEVPIEYDLYFGKSFGDVIKLVNGIEEDFAPKDEDDQVEEFSKDFDDSNFRIDQFRQKKTPPTKAYVSLLALYDRLNKETKRLGLNKYQGYTDKVLQELAETSTGTSAYQLRTVLSKILERSEVTDANIVQKIRQFVVDLDETGSYINLALKYIPPLPFAV